MQAPLLPPLHSSSQQWKLMRQGRSGAGAIGQRSRPLIMSSRHMVVLRNTGGRAFPELWGRLKTPIYTYD
jgi:hypothetical protein